MNPDRAAGIGGALRALADRPYGPWLLGLAGLGFVAYGLHCAWLGRFRQLRSS
jgi:hypothetical protein